MLPDNAPSYPSREWIYGHRLRAGQTAIEYLLEFLNVAKGFEFILEQPVSADPTKHEEQPAYCYDYRLNLRRYLFLREESGGKNRHPADLELLDRMHTALASHPNLDPETVDSARQLLNSFTIVSGVKGRSWFAKFLFPAHADLLFFEARRDAAKTKKAISQPYQTAPTADLGKGIAIERNFFSRGGELYFLMLAHAAQLKPERARRVGKRLETLLVKHNPRLGELARNIDSMLPIPVEHGEGEEKTVTIGWIPVDSDGLFEQALEEIDNLLGAQVDPIEHVYLLARLIPLHLLQHIYRRSHAKYPFAAFDLKTRVSSIEVLPTIFIDCGRGGENREIRRLSALTYKRNDYLQEEKFKMFLSHLGRHAAEHHEHAEAAYDELAVLLNFSKVKQKDRTQGLRGAMLASWETGFDARARATQKGLENTELGEFRKQHLPVHRKLCYGIGFVQPVTGANQRYVFNDTILKALVVALVPPGREIEFADFVGLLFDRYGIVIGAEEARASGLFQEARINTEHYDRNLASFRRRMKEAGLLTELSDATAFVSNPYQAQAD
jgi:hypothetical protein